MNARIQSTLLLINVAFDLAALSKCRIGRLKLANMHDDIVLRLQILNNELNRVLLKEALVGRLATTLRMQDSPVKDDHLLAFLHTLSWSIHVQYSVAG